MEFWVEPEHEAFRRWLDLFVGTYDARNFARLEEGKNPIRTVLETKPWMDGGRLIGFEVSARPSFGIKYVAWPMHCSASPWVSLMKTRFVKRLNSPWFPLILASHRPNGWLWGVAWERASARGEPHTVFSAPPTEEQRNEPETDDGGKPLSMN